MEVLDKLAIKRVAAEAYLTESFNETVYCQLEPKDYHKHKQEREFDITDFYQHPSDYKSTFLPFIQSDLLIAAAYWDSKAPLFIYKRTDEIN